MKQKRLLLFIAIVLAVLALTFFGLSIFQDEHNQLFLTIGLSCSTVGLFTSLIARKREK